MQTGDYAADLVAATNTGQKLGYSYQLQLMEDGLWLTAMVLEPGPQSGDQPCWQLWLHETGQRQAFDKQGNQTLACD